MYIDQRRHRKIYHSLYSDVFHVDETVYKLFKDSIDSGLRQRACEVFEAQRDAFERATEDETLRLHIPRYYGTCEVEGVIGCDGTSSEQKYLFDHCYVLEFLHGEEMKVTHETVTSRYPEVFHLRQRFEQRHIETHDASVFISNAPKSFKFIDIQSKLSISK